MNRRRPFVALVSLTSLLLLPPVPGGTAGPQEVEPPKSQDLPTFGVATSAVTLDIVVRDKKGKAVRDLKASDFEVYEDGVLQKVESFEVFGRPLAAPAVVAAGPAPVSATPAAAPAPAGPVPPAAGAETRPQVIAFVFDRLSAEARNTALKASRTYLDKGYIEGDLVGVFAIDLALQSVQPFTTDKELIKAGLESAAAQGNTAFSDNRQRTRNLLDASATAARGTPGAGTNPGGPGGGASASSVSSAAAGAALTQQFSNLQAGMLRNFESLERDQQGYASTNGLLAVVSGLKSLPGRKTVVFFSEGLAIPTNVLAQFRSVIHNANRANVSVYAMDAAGLRVNSTNEETRNEMMQSARRRVAVLESGTDDTSGPMTAGLERNEDLLRLNSESGLGQLANETGGFLIRDTNDAAAAFGRIEEDMRFHYLLGYSPSNENYDGKFRSVSIKVKRSGMVVQGRQGYIGLRPAESALPQKEYEGPALAVLDSKKKSHDFPIEAVALSFPATDRPGLVPVLVRVPGNTMTFVEEKVDKSAKPAKSDKNVKPLHRADFSVVVRVKNDKGVEVDRVSQHYLLSASAEDLAAARRGDILFYREADLGPGRHTLEAVAYDAMAQKSSVNTVALELPSVEEGRPRLSSIVLVGRAEKVPPEEQSKTNPLYFGETLLYPNMGESFKKSASPAMGFFFTVYGVKAGGTAPRAMIEVLKDGKPAGQVTAELPAPDPTGRIQYAGALPLQGFAAGAYRLKVTAQTGAGFDSRQTSFVVAE